MAWELLMRSNYEDLRSCLFSSQKELKRFRQLLVNSVIATDIFDPELKKQREEKWAKAFSGEDGSEVTSVGFNRKATIIIEQYVVSSYQPLRFCNVSRFDNRGSYPCCLKFLFSRGCFSLIQASDVAHTMQHWHIYRVSPLSELEVPRFLH
jgi:hypothetical protein